MPLRVFWLSRIGPAALAILVSVTTASSSPACNNQVPSGDRLPADALCTTAGGTNFTAPAGWTVVAKPGALVLGPPESDSHLTLVDVEAADAASAVAASWARSSPATNRPVRVATTQESRNGWDERHLYQYETSPNEKLVIHVLALRAGRSWTIAMVEASSATFERQGAAFSLVEESLQPGGYQREMFAGRAAHALDAGRIALIKDFIADQMRRFGVPGVGLSLIDGGKIVFEGGLGARALGAPEPVDADTLFLSGSITKALTTLLLARLVDDGRLRWDQPVTEVYPNFKLGDVDTTRRVLVRHLVCACTGFPRQDMEWLFNFAKATPASALALLSTMQPTSRFGEVYQYNNLMAAAAGYTAAFVLHPERELGVAYDEAMRTRIFEPLAMTHTTFSFEVALRSNHANPHGIDVEGKTVEERMDRDYSIVPLRPAGGMWTSAGDLGRYIEMELSEGVLRDGSRLVTTENLIERRRSQIQTDYRQSYGMGLMVNMQRGIPIVYHFGALPGYRSLMMFLPEHGVGAVVLTNSDSGEYLTGLVFRRLLEVLFDGNSEAAERASAAATRRTANIAEERGRLVVPADVAEAAKLALRYVNPALGELRVEVRNDATIFDFGAWRSAVASRRNDDGTTSFVTIDPAADRWAFVVGSQGTLRTLIARDAQHEYVFVEAR